MKVKIPIIEIYIYVWFGKKGLKKLTEKIHEDDKEWQPEKYMAGYCASNYIWLNEYNRKTLLHELTHFYDWLYNFLSCQDESEFKAFLQEYITDKIIKKLEE